MNSKKILCIDMDNVSVDFASGIFSLMESVTGYNVLHKTAEIKNKYRIL
jgi:hypothetical protein